MNVVDNSKIQQDVRTNMQMIAWLVLSFIVLYFAYTPAYCAPAGALVRNTASVTLLVDGTPLTRASNTAITTIQSLVDVSNTAISATADMIAPGVSGYSYAYVVTNTGNASDTFSLDAAFTNLSEPVASVWVDVNGNGKLDASDTRLSDSDPTVTLAAGAQTHLLVEAVAGGTMRLTATSLNDDPVAIVWHRFAAAQIRPSGLRSNFVVRLIKSQTVDTKGAAQPGRGTIITYSLEAVLPLLTGATGARIHDSIPTGTTYVPGSLTIDDQPLSDAADGDAGAFDATAKAISVALPDPPPNSATDPSVDDTGTHTVRFQVRIN